MIKIAVVGDIGSGKSHVAKQFGCPVFNADTEVAIIYKQTYLQRLDHKHKDSTTILNELLRLAEVNKIKNSAKQIIDSQIQVEKLKIKLKTKGISVFCLYYT